MIATGLEYLRVWMIISAFMYFLAGLIFLFGQNWILRRINGFSSTFSKSRPLIPESTEKFWLVLTTSMMLMLTACSVFVAAAPQKYMAMAVIILVSKACSTSLYIVFFARQKYLAYLVGALTDGILFLATFVLFIWAAL